MTSKIVINAPPFDPRWWPTTPNIRVDRDPKIYFPRSEVQDKISAVRQAWQQLTDQVCDAAKEAGMGSRSWRRCIKKLSRITGDKRWEVIESNL